MVKHVILYLFKIMPRLKIHLLIFRSDLCINGYDILLRCLKPTTTNITEKCDKYQLREVLEVYIQVNYTNPETCMNLLNLCYIFKWIFNFSVLTSLGPLIETWKYLELCSSGLALIPGTGSWTKRLVSLKYKRQTCYKNQNHKTLIYFLLLIWTGFFVHSGLSKHQWLLS